MKYRVACSQFRVQFLRTRALHARLAVVALLLCLSAIAQNSPFTTFNAPGAGTAANQGTFAYSVNSQGEIAGFFLDAKNIYHGFLRSPAGIFTAFEAPGAGNVSGRYQGTYALAINSAGAVAGFYRDANDMTHGFLRSPEGTFATFEAPGAGSKSNQGTFAYGLNSTGEVAGFFLDPYDVYHGFLRSSSGVITTFEASGAGDIQYSDQGTLAGLYADINSSGAITGFYLDANELYHGFVRSPYGAFDTFEASGAGTTAGSYYGTFPSSINDPGIITGYYIDGHGIDHGFLRSADGAFTTFNAPGAGTRSGQGTLPTDVNDLGAITGYLVNLSGAYDGFVRAPNGNFTTITAPGAGTAAGQGTLPLGSNEIGQVTGYYTDAKNVNHGFVR